MQKFRQQTQQNKQHNHVKAQHNDAFSSSASAVDSLSNRSIDNGRETDAVDRSVLAKSTPTGGTSNSIRFVSKINNQQQPTEHFDVAGKVHYHFLLLSVRHISFGTFCGLAIHKIMMQQTN